MPKDDEAGTGVVDASQKQSGQDQDSPQVGTEQPETYAGGYKTREETEKGIAEKDAYISKIQSEKDRLAAEVTKIQNERLTMLEEIQKVKSATSRPSISNAEYVEKLAERLRNAEDGSKEYALLAQELAEGNMQYANSLVSEKEKALNERIEKLTASLEGLTQRVNPEYQAHKEDVDKLMSKGLPYDAALIAAKELAAVKQPTRPTPIGASGGNRVGSSDAAGMLSDQDKNQIRAQLKNRFSKEQIENTILRLEKARMEKSNG